MYDYRVYSFNGRNKIADAQWIQAENDLQVIGLVQAINRTAKCEIWEGRRLVAQIAATALHEANSAQLPPQGRQLPDL